MGELMKQEEERILKELTDEDLTFPMYLCWEDGCIETVGKIPSIFDMIPSNDDNEVEQDDELYNFIPGKGYVMDGIVYQYLEEKPKRVTSPVPYFYMTTKEDKDGKVVRRQMEMKYPLTREETVRRFGIQKLVDQSFQRIVNETTGNEVLYDENIIDDMNAARSKYVPDIRKDDDCLKKLIKYLILKKDVDINKYKSAMDTSYALTNMKSALISKTKMSITYFLMWIELLGVDFSIAIQDNGSDRQDPLKESLIYKSIDNEIYSYDPKKYSFALTKYLSPAEQKEFADTVVKKLMDETYEESTEEDDDEEE